MISAAVGIGLVIILWKLDANDESSDKSSAPISSNAASTPITSSTNPSVINNDDSLNSSLPAAAGTTRSATQIPNSSGRIDETSTKPIVVESFDECVKRFMSEFANKDPTCCDLVKLWKTYKSSNHAWKIEEKDLINKVQSIILKTWSWSKSWTVACTASTFQKLGYTCVHVQK